MILSQEQLFSDGQVVTADAASTNVIDLGATGTLLGNSNSMERDIGKGRPVPIIVQLDADATGTTPTLTVEVQVSVDEAFTTPIVVASAPMGTSAGDRINLQYVPEGTNERYLRLNYDVGGTTPSFTVTAGIVLARQSA